MAKKHKFGEWIKVEDELPEQEMSLPWLTADVMVWDGDAVISPAFYYLDAVPSLGWASGDWRHADIHLQGVTHWMPMPDGPEL